ncbi:MAG: class I SAM-dependent rRNA methyltransferase [Deltaproteobacteria bacterium]|nr:class I SAM-dependent rRNA methyltransferase [Deltaproteobacteria bacterium]
MSYPTIFLKAGKDGPLKARHPWVYAGAVDASRTGEAPAGPVEVRDDKENLIGVGTYSPTSAIAVRMFAFEDARLDEAFFRARFGSALALRRAVLPADTDGYRLVNSEGDGVPGLVVDSFAGHLVVQVGTAGIDALTHAWLPALLASARPLSIRSRADQSAANREGMEAPRGTLAGDPPQRTDIREAGLAFTVDLEHGQKTGFFFDHRENRRLVASLARGRNVLDGFSHTGAFACNALAAGAKRVVAVESSEAAAALLDENVRRTGRREACEIATGDCFELVRKGGETFDIVILDPPSLAKRRQHVDRAARAYKDLFLHGLRRVSPGGFLLACSCSGAVDRRLFDQIVFAAALDAGRPVRVLARRGAAPDHPVSVYHPEGEYLKALLLAVQ